MSLGYAIKTVKTTSGIVYIFLCGVYYNVVPSITLLDKFKVLVESEFFSSKEVEFKTFPCGQREFAPSASLMLLYDISNLIFVLTYCTTRGLKLLKRR